MFNRVAQQEFATSHNIRDIMSRSRKRTPITCWCGCKSQKRGKQFSNRRFRRCERQNIRTGRFGRIPIYPIELTPSWDLGGDGKGYFHASPTDEWYIKLMRK